MRIISISHVSPITINKLMDWPEDRYSRQKDEKNNDEGTGSKNSNDGLEPVRKVGNCGIYTDGHVAVDPEGSTSS